MPSGSYDVRESGLLAPYICNAVRVRGAVGPGGERDRVTVLVQRQGFRCALTGAELTPKTAVLDHIEPLDKGGAHHIDNLQVVTKRANRAKGTLSQSDFVALCRAVAKKHEE